MAISPRTLRLLSYLAQCLPPGHLLLGNAKKHFRKEPASGLLLTSALCLLTSTFPLGGCRGGLFPNAGSGTHLDPQEKTPSHRPTAKAATVQAEVTTDASNQVVMIRILRSSGSSSVDDFVADSIRQGFPAAPSTRSVVEINYKPGAGFSDPRILSTTTVSPAS